MGSTPDTLLARFELAGCDFTAAIAALARALREAGTPIVGWAIPARAKLRTGGLEDWFAEIAAGAALPERPSMRFELKDDGGGAVDPGGAPSAWRVRVHRPVEDLPRAQRRAVLDALLVVARQLAREPGARGAIEWSGGAEFPPEVPLAGTRALAVIAADHHVAEDYEDVARFWAAWEQVETIGGAALATRALDAADGAELIARIGAGQWAMARAAKPGRTGYFLPELDADEQAAFRAGERRLHMVGHDPAAGLVELAAALAPGEHLRGWEILDLWYALEQAELDGRPLREARVVFSDRAAAKAELRPMRDVGARVFYPGDDGEDVELV